MKSPQETDRHVTEILDALRVRGHRMTPQRRAIVAEIIRTEGHIAPQDVVARVQERVPAVNASTVYRTLDLLEEAGFLSHSHHERGHEYHRVADHDHVHLVCSACGKAESLPVIAVEPLREAVARHNGFLPDFTHFAVSGLCADCRDASP